MNKFSIIDQDDLSEILGDVFQAVANDLRERARYDGTGRDESAALEQVASVIENVEPEWHVQDVLDRRTGKEKIDG